MSIIKNKADAGGRIKKLRNGTEKVLKGKTRYASALSMKRMLEGKVQEQGKVEADTNIEIGNFVAELATGLRFKEQDSLDEGDWVEEPERMFGDGLVFGEEVKSATDDKLQITVTLDTSRSMWNQKIMKYAAPTFRALDRMLRLAQAELPPGVLAYSPFIFHETAFRLPRAWVDHFSQNSFKQKSKYRNNDGGFTTYESESYMLPSEHVNLDRWDEACAEGEISTWTKSEHPHYGEPGHTEWLNAWKSYPMVGNDTLLSPLFKAVEDWEAGNNHDATRLDIIITDGQFESEADARAATAIQERRNGKLTTILLNFLAPRLWAQGKLPDRCLQYPVDSHNIGTSVRSVILEAVGSML